MTTACGSPDMDPQLKARLHRLVDDLPEEEVRAAERYQQFLCDRDDPVISAMRSAPEDDEPLTDEDRKAIDEGRRDIAAGRGISDSQIRRKLGL